MLSTILSLFCVSAQIVTGIELTSYSSQTVFEFIQSAAQHNVSEQCRRSLLRVQPFLNAHDTLPEQRAHFISAFASGDSKGYMSRDRSRWHYRFLNCLHAAGESVAVSSEHPLIFCSGQYIDQHNGQYDASTPNGTAISACLPAPCDVDHLQMMELWSERTSSEGMGVRGVGCTRSRYEHQWFQLPVPVTEFASNKLIMWIVACATIYHCMRGLDTHSLAMRIFLAFSLKRNFRAITALPSDPHSTVTCIFGLRFLATLWVILGHSSIFIQDFLSNPEEYTQQLRDSFFAQVVTNCMLSVDLFFVLSATLTSFHWFRSLHRSGHDPKWSSIAYWLRFYRHRVLRLWPAYLYVMLVIIFRFSRSHIHPMWAPNDQGAMCRANWWKNALFINSLTDNLCMPWTWYIGTEFVFFLLTPLFLLALKHSFGIGALLSVLCICASGTLHVVESIRYNFPPTQMLWVQPELFNQDFMQHHLLLYIRPEYRIAPYIIGLILGYLMASAKPVGCIGYTVKFICTGWVSAIILAFSSLFGLYPAIQGWDWPVYHLVYGATHRVMWALAVAWLIYACHNGIGGPFNTLLSCRIFFPLAAACYSTYLVHLVTVMGVFVKASFPIVYSGPMTVITYCLHQIFVSFFIGTITLFLIELPAINIERILLRGNRTDRSKQNLEMELKKNLVEK